MWKRAFTQLESAAFAERVVVDAVLEEGYGKDLFGPQSTFNMMYWSVRIL